MMHRVFRKVTILFLFIVPTLLQAQEVKIKAGFIQDSLRLGDQLDYYLVARYPSQLTVLFPDSIFDFSPFEFHKKNYFPTETIQGESYDSVVYRFYSFEVDDIQYLALPVFSVNARDCTVYVSPKDSVFLKSMVEATVLDSVTAQDLPLKTNTLYQKVYQLFNYPILLIAGGSLIVISILTWIIFGKRIRKYLKLKKLKKEHSKFTESYASIVTPLRDRFVVDKTETALSLWKKYLEHLERKPYTKLTTRETIRLENDEELGKSLHLLDKAIYGNSTSVMPSLEHLHRVANERFNKKVEEVKHG